MGAMTVSSCLRGCAWDLMFEAPEFHLEPKRFFGSHPKVKHLSKIEQSTLPDLISFGVQQQYLVSSIVRLRSPCPEDAQAYILQRGTAQDGQCHKKLKSRTRSTFLRQGSSFQNHLIKSCPEDAQRRQAYIYFNVAQPKTANAIKNSNLAPDPHSCARAARSRIT